MGSIGPAGMFDSKHPRPFAEVFQEFVDVDFDLDKISLYDGSGQVDRDRVMVYELVRMIFDRYQMQRDQTYLDVQRQFGGRQSSATWAGFHQETPSRSSVTLDRKVLHAEKIKHLKSAQEAILRSASGESNKQSSLRTIAENIRCKQIEQEMFSKKFKVVIECKHFLPEDLVIKIKDDHLVIHGKHEMKLDEHGSITREFTLRFPIPGNVNQNAFKAIYDQSGVLIVKSSFKENVKIIGIQKEHVRNKMDLLKKFK